MGLCLTEGIDRLARLVTGRPTSRFAATLAATDTVREGVAGKRLLVVGGAGSIGSATVFGLLAHGPAAVVVVDTSENNSVELLRSVRSDPQLAGCRLGIEPLDYGSPLCAAWLAEQEPFDLVLSFAALKHVRSERDPISTLRMCEVNLTAADRFLTACRRHGHGQEGVFFVSTDKAADPINLMGASKRIMEAVLWAHAQADAPASLLDPEATASAPLPRVTTTRFANVAFSDGSLPWGFLQRLAKQQPLAGPADVRRFMVTLEEAGHICQLAALAAPAGHVLVPDLDPDADSVRFDAIARHVVEDAGYQPAIYEDEDSARAAIATDLPAGRWPILMTRSDTSGEKEMETFVGRQEQPLDCGLEGFSAIRGEPVAAHQLSHCLGRIDACLQGVAPIPDKIELADWFHAVVPAFAHHDTGTSLDGKM